MIFRHDFLSSCQKNISNESCLHVFLSKTCLHVKNQKTKKADAAFFLGNVASAFVFFLCY